MLSPLFDCQEFLFDEEGWDMSVFHREAAALTDMAEFWADVESEAQRLDIVPPAENVPADGSDWSIPLETDERQEKLVHHDCMWAGSCADSAHPSNTFVPAEPAPGRSLLKKERAPSPPRPDTPPSLDEEEPPQFRHAVDVAGTALRLLRDSAAVAADHSYTLAKPTPPPPAPVDTATLHKHQFENLGVQTPSDSEEEIDVVSLGEGSKGSPPLTTCRTDALPHVPSALDRHHIQRTVLSAMSPRAGSTGPRKRGSTGGSSGGSRKRHRAGRRARRSPTASDSDAESPEIERRSLHNDMERMRRIGLKNLFDELKRQVPATREKERAPKVVILREAAALCRRLQQDEAEREHLRRQQGKLMARLRRLRSKLAQRYQNRQQAY